MEGEASHQPPDAPGMTSTGLVTTLQTFAVEQTLMSVSGRRPHQVGVTDECRATFATPWMDWK